jgi:hypothetical protein
VSIKKTPWLFDEVQDVRRLHHCSIHAERAVAAGSSDTCFITTRGHVTISRGGEGKIAEFLTHLAAEGHGVVPSTQWHPVKGLKFRFFPYFFPCSFVMALQHAATSQNRCVRRAVSRHIQGNLTA